jgi:hypothetical protein
LAALSNLAEFFAINTELIPVRANPRATSNPRPRDPPVTNASLAADSLDVFMAILCLKDCQSAR